MSGSWANSDRKARLPDEWAELVRLVKRRAGGQCEAIRSKSGRRCTKEGTDVDHITPGDDHRLVNLQLLCRWHHAHKSSREGNAAKAARSSAAHRPTERHPGARTP